MHNAPPKRSFVHVNNGSNSLQELKDFVYITSTIQTLKNTKAVYITLLYEILPLVDVSMEIYRELIFEGVFCR